MMARFHITRLFASLAVLLQMALPLAQAQAVANGTDLSALICNPSGQSLSADAKAAMSELLDVIGDPEDTEPVADCERCVTPNTAISGPSSRLTPPISYTLARTATPHAEAMGPQTPRGPPCGRRAPPTFI